MKFNCFIIINLKLINGFQESFLLSCIDSHKYVTANSLAALFKTLFAIIVYLNQLMNKLQM